MEVRGQRYLLRWVYMSEWEKSKRLQMKIEKEDDDPVFYS